jgi:hypothetical protein
MAKPMIFLVVNADSLLIPCSFKTDPSSRPKSSSHLMSMGLDFLELEDLSLTIPGIERERVRMPKAMLFGLIVEGLQQRMIGIAFSLLRNYGVLGSASKILNAATSVRDTTCLFLFLLRRIEPLPSFHLTHVKMFYSIV